jgi:hypothetical protein
VYSSESGSQYEYVPSKFRFQLLTFRDIQVCNCHENAEGCARSDVSLDDGRVALMTLPCFDECPHVCFSDTIGTCIME